MALAIRQLTLADCEPIAPIVNAAYKRTIDSTAELRRYLHLQPDGWLLAELDGEPAGMVGAVDYGSRAWVGLMAVNPPLQGRGIARALMEALLGWLDGRRCPTIVLDASEAGAPLYEKLRFLDVDLVDFYRMSAPSPTATPPPSVRPMTGADMPAVMALDAAAFGHERAAMLASFFADDPGRAFVHSDPAGTLDGYLIAQSMRIGPWIATTPAVAEGLLAAALTLPYEDGPTALVPQANVAGAALLTRHGFTRQRRLRHMRRGVPAVGDRRDLRYGQASFTLG